MERDILPKMFAVGGFIKTVTRKADTSALKLPINKTCEKVLMFIRCNDNLTMSELSERTGLEKSSFTRVVDKLIAVDYVTREYDTVDRRKIMVRMTDKGLETTNKISEMLDGYIYSALDTLSEDALAQLDAALTTTTNILSTIKR